MIWVIAVVATLAALPLLAGLVRRALPRNERVASPVPPIVFGLSPKARPSPRHAVLLHRGLIGAVFFLVLALTVVPAAVALGATGEAVIPAVFAFVLPTLLVGLHVRRRSLDEWR